MLRQIRNKKEDANIRRTSRTHKTLMTIFGIVIIVNLHLQQIPIIKAAGLRLQENSTCKAKGERGICKTWTNCPILETLIERHEYSVETVESCGFAVRDELICCPTESIPKIDGKFTQIEDNSKQEESPRNDRPAVRACARIRSGKTPVLSNKILGGTEAKFAHVVAILYISYGNDGDGPYIARCGGTLIDERFVLTAAHCVSTYSEAIPSTVRMGVSNFSDPDEMRDAVEIKIKKTYIHDEYSIRHSYNDIAILELEEPVSYSDNIYPACLHTDEVDPGPDVKLTASGWGVTNMTTRASSNVLQKVSLHVTPLQECNDRFQKYGMTPTIHKGIIRTLLCAEDENNIKDSCQGDSGGPLHRILDEKLSLYSVVGVIASGFGCAVMPGLYTRVASFLDFIEPIVWPEDVV